MVTENCKKIEPVVVKLCSKTDIPLFSWTRRTYIINNWTSHWSTALVQCVSRKPWNYCEHTLPVKSKMADGAQIDHYLNRNNSSGSFSVSLKFDTEFDHPTVDTLQTFTVKRSKVKVTEYFSQCGMQHVTHFKVIRSNLAMKRAWS